MPSFVWYTTFFVVMLLALWTRLSYLGDVLIHGEYIPLDGDSAYHLRRTLLTVQEFPHVPFFDPEMNWPIGGACPWAGGFDQFSASLIHLSGQADSRLRATLVAGSVPVLLGLLSVVLTIPLTLSLLPRTPAALWSSLSALLLAALLPQSAVPARFGRTDHHVAETLFMVTLTLWLMRRFPDRDFSQRSLSFRIAFEGVGAALIAISVLGFSGSVLYVAPIALILMINSLLTPRLPPAAWLGSGTLAFLGGGVLTLHHYAVAVSEHGHQVSFGFPSYLQPVLLLIAGVGCFLAALVAYWISGSVDASLLLKRLGVLSLGAMVPALAVLLLLPGLLPQIQEALLGWLARRDPWLANVTEFRSILETRGPLALHIRDLLGIPGLLTPVVLPLATLRSFRHSPRRALAFGLIAFLMAAFTLLQMRFGRLLVPFLVIGTAICLHEATVSLARWRGNTRRPLLYSGPVLISLGLCLGDSQVRSHLTWKPERELAAIEQAAIFIRDYDHPFALADSQLATKRTVTVGSEVPPIGVLAPWDLGHMVHFLSGHPVIANGFGSYMDSKTFYEVENSQLWPEEQLIGYLREKGIGWVIAGASTIQGRVVGPQGAMPFVRLNNGRGIVNPIFLRALPLGPLLLGGSGLSENDINHCQHLMPVFASTQLVGGLEQPLPILWVYEPVAGALLVGQALPYERIRAEIVITAASFAWTFEAWTTADSDGRFALRTPVASNFVTNSIETSAHYSVTGNSFHGQAEVSESAVREGRQLNVVRTAREGPIH